MRKKLCDSNCNECEAIQNKQVALLLNVLALRFGDEVWGITNRICANLTCCPICHIDDFCHFDDNDGAFVTPINRVMVGHETCEVAEEAMKVFEEIEREKNNASSRANQKA